MTDLAHRAAALWGMTPDQVVLAARRENVVYRCETPEGVRALRLHRVGYRSRAELVSELEWMEVLAEEGMRVPHPVPSDQGHLIEMLGDRPVSVLSWLEGAPAGAGGRLDVPDRGAFMHDLGRSLAELHGISDAWRVPEAFTRPRWDFDGLLGDDPLWGPFWDNPDLRAQERALLLEARGKARMRLAGIERDLDFGLIHADILTENVLVNGPHLSLIDFDDGGWGFRDFELATILMRFLDAPDYADLRAALLAGYGARRAVNGAVLDFFILLRALTYLGWIIPRHAEPGGAARSLRAVETALPLVRRFLDG